MSAKRKSDGVKKPAKRGRKKPSVDEFDSDVSDINDDVDTGPKLDEVLITGHGDEFEPPTKLPDVKKKFNLLKLFRKIL